MFPHKNFHNFLQFIRFHIIFNLRHTMRFKWSYHSLRLHHINIFSTLRIISWIKILIHLFNLQNFYFPIQSLIYLSFNRLQRNILINKKIRNLSKCMNTFICPSRRNHIHFLWKNRFQNLLYFPLYRFFIYLSLKSKKLASIILINHFHISLFQFFTSIPLHSLNNHNYIFFSNFYSLFLLF